MTPEQAAALEAWERETEAYFANRDATIQPLVAAQNKCRELGVPGFPPK
jgi:hypothetical protein